MTIRLPLEVADGRRPKAPDPDRFVRHRQFPRHPDLYWPFFMRPVISIIEPSCALISAITFFGPFIRKCMPSGMSTLPG